MENKSIPLGRFREGWRMQARNAKDI